MRRLILALCLLSAPALAGDHFDRDSVVGQSAAFRSVSQASLKALEPRERALTRTDQALADLDLSLALTRGALDTAQHELWLARLDERSTRFGGEFGLLQEQLTEMSVGYEQAFEAALQRAVSSLRGAGTDIEECVPTKDLMGGLAQPGGATSSKKCPGADRSSDIAAAWDQDSALKAALDAIDPAAFQDVTSYEGAEPPLAVGAGSGPMWIHPASLAEELPEAIEVIDAVDQRASRARESLREARSMLAPEDEDGRKAVVQRARGVREWSEDQKAAIGAVVWGSLERTRKKGRKAGWSGVGICLNPAGWSGCAGDDVTSEVAEAMLADKKLAKELGKFLDGLGEPDVALK